MMLPGVVCLSGLCRLKLPCRAVHKLEQNPEGTVGNCSIFFFYLLILFYSDSKAEGWKRITWQESPTYNVWIFLTFPQCESNLPSVEALPPILLWVFAGLCSAVQSLLMLMGSGRNWSSLSPPSGRGAVDTLPGAVLRR